MNQLNQTLINKVTQALADNSPKVQTPCYIFDSSIWAERFRAMEEMLGTKLVCSFKANPNSELLARTEHVASIWEVASLTELKKVSPYSGVVYVNNPSMDKTFIRSAIAAKAHIIVDGLEHLADIKNVANNQIVQPLMLRLNACVLSTVFPDFKVRGDHFGMDLDTAMKAIDEIKANENLSLAGFHLFVGSYSFKKCAKKIAETIPHIIEMFELRYENTIHKVNLGGGFSEDWPESHEDVADYKAMLDTLPTHIEVLHESGRGIYASCGVFITTVVRKKVVDGEHYAICDGGINQNFLLGQTENRFSSPKEPLIIRNIEPTDEEEFKTMLVGSTCSKDDVIGISKGSQLRTDDKCVFLNCGAYNSTYTVSNFLGLKEPKFYVFP